MVVQNTLRTCERNIFFENHFKFEAASDKTISINELLPNALHASVTYYGLPSYIICLFPLVYISFNFSTNVNN